MVSVSLRHNIKGFLLVESNLRTIHRQFFKYQCTRKLVLQEVKSWVKQPPEKYCQTCSISHSLVGNKLVDHWDVFGALPVSAAPTTYSFSTSHLASVDWAKTTVRLDEKILVSGFDVAYTTYQAFSLSVILSLVGTQQTIIFLVRDSCFMQLLAPQWSWIHAEMLFGNNASVCPRSNPKKHITV